MLCGMRSPTTMRYAHATPKHLVRTAVSMTVARCGEARSATDLKVTGLRAILALTEVRCSPTKAKTPHRKSKKLPRMYPVCAYAKGSPRMPAPHIVLTKFMYDVKAPDDSTFPRSNTKAILASLASENQI